MEEREDFRLSERDRTWHDPELAAPPLAETQAHLAERWAALAAERQRVREEIGRRRDEFIALLQELVRIPSVNPSPEWEQPLATVVAQRMRALGMQVRQLEPAPKRVSNLSTLHGAGAGRSLLRNLLYFAHLDTVPPGDARNWRFDPFSATIADGRMYGRGVKDCKHGMAAALANAAAIQSAGIALDGDLLVVTPCDEETGGHLGIAAMIDAGWLEGVEGCVYAEGMPHQLTIGAFGGVKFRVAVRGRSTHTARKELGVNAILHACAVAQAIDAVTFDDCSPHPVVPGQPVASVNLISGGFKLNVVPDLCTLDVDLRFPPGYTAEQALAQVEQAIEALRAEERYRALDAQIAPLSISRPYAMSADQPIVQAVALAAEDVLGERPTPQGMQASSDARWLYLDARIPTVKYSFGNDSAHLPNEYMDIEGYIKNIEVFALTNLLLLGAAPHR
jgi:acetylornithine deacetylase/succinyl-diaminopimelate desuccinylase family protein